MIKICNEEDESELHDRHTHQMTITGCQMGHNPQCVTSLTGMAASVCYQDRAYRKSMRILIVGLLYRATCIKIIMSCSFHIDH